jgi:hypothetical protein
VKKWYYVLAIAMVGVMTILINRSMTPIKYTSELTFMVNEESDNMGGVGNLLGVLGVGEIGGEFNLEKILELAQSRRIFQDAFFESYALEGVTDLYANHFIRELEKEGEWATNEWYEVFKPESKLKGFLFQSDSLRLFSRLENAALMSLHKKVRRSLDMRVDDLTQIMYMQLESTSEVLAVDFLKTLFKSLSAFYIDKAIEKQFETVKVISEKRDSLAELLNNKDYALANRRDGYRDFYLEREGVPNKQLEREISMLTLMYGESVKNAEVADFALKNRIPFVQIIDEPMAPCRINKGSLPRELFRALLLGLVLGLGVMILKKTWDDAIGI